MLERKLFAPGRLGLMGLLNFVFRVYPWPRHWGLFKLFWEREAHWSNGLTAGPQCHRNMPRLGYDEFFHLHTHAVHHVKFLQK